MNDINEVRLQGRVTHYPGVTRLDNGTTVARFSIAVNRYRKDENGEFVQFTDFFNLALFGKFAELYFNELDTGTPVIVTGSLRQQKWTDKDGKNHVSVGIQVERLFIGKRHEKTDGASSETTDTSFPSCEGIPVSKDEIPETCPEVLPELEGIDIY